MNSRGYRKGHFIQCYQYRIPRYDTRDYPIREQQQLFVECPIYCVRRNNVERDGVSPASWANGAGTQFFVFAGKFRLSIFHTHDTRNGGGKPRPIPFLAHITNALEIVTSPVPTVADDDYQSNNDGDSAFDAMSNNSETATVSSSLLKLREENGRTYHTYGM